MRFDDVTGHALNSKSLASEDLSLLLVTGIENGLPVLTGAEQDRQIVSLAPVTKDQIGKLAACRFAEAGAQKLVVVLGYVAPTPETIMALLSSVAIPAKGTASGSLRFACGRSELRLDPDGRISLTGDDVLLRARKGMRVRGATIDLN